MIVNRLGSRKRSHLGIDRRPMEWRQFNLSEMTEMSNSGLNSVTQDRATGIWTVEVDRETETKKIGSGAQWGINLPSDWSWSDLQWAAVSIEWIGSGTNLASSNFYSAAGVALTTAAGFNTAGAVSLMQDGTGGPDVGVILSTTDTVNPSYSAAQASVVGVIGEFAIGPGNRLLNCTATAVTGYNPQVYKYVKRATASTSVSAQDKNFGFFIACGIDNDGAAGAVTMSFRAHYLLSGRHGTRDANWFNNNDG